MDSKHTHVDHMSPVGIKHNVYENAIVLIHHGWSDLLWRALYIGKYNS